MVWLTDFVTIIIRLPLRLTLVVSVLCSATDAFASSAFTSYPRLQGAPYLTDCEGLLSALENGLIDQFLLSRARNADQLFELFFDYGLVFSRQFVSALTAELREREIEIPQYESDIMAVKEDLQGIIDLPEADAIKFTRSVFEHLRLLSAGSANEREARHFHLRTHRLFKAIEQSPDREKIELQYFSYIKRCLLTSLRDGGFSARMRTASKVTGSFWFQLGAKLIGAPIAGAIYMDLSPESWESIWPFLSSIVAGGCASGCLVTKIENYIHERWVPDISKLYPDATFSLSPQWYRGARRSAGKQKIPSIIDHNYGDDEKVIARVSAPRLQSQGASTLTTKASVKRLSPVDLLYLGHIDIVEIQGVLKEFNHFFSTDRVQTISESVIGKARNVLQVPQRMQSRLGLLAAVEDLLETFVISRVDDHVYNRLKDHIEAAVSTLNRLDEYVQTKDKSIPADARRILKMKLESDLKKLAQLKFRPSAVDELVSQIQPQLDKLIGISGAPKTSDREWIQFAEDVILLVNQIQGAMSR